MLGTEESQRHERGKYHAQHETTENHNGGVAQHTHSPYSSSPLSDARATPFPSPQQQQQQQQQQPAPPSPYRASPGSPDPLAMHSPGHVAKQQRMIVEQYRRIDEVEGQLHSLTLRWRSSTTLAMSTIGSLEEEVARNLEHITVLMGQLHDAGITPTIPSDPKVHRRLSQIGALPFGPGGPGGAGGAGGAEGAEGAGAPRPFIPGAIAAVAGGAGGAGRSTPGNTAATADAATAAAATAVKATTTTATATDATTGGYARPLIHAATSSPPLRQAPPPPVVAVAGQRERLERLRHLFKTVDHDGTGHALLRDLQAVLISDDALRPHFVGVSRLAVFLSYDTAEDGGATALGMFPSGVISWQQLLRYVLQVDRQSDAVGAAGAVGVDGAAGAPVGASIAGDRSTNAHDSPRTGEAPGGRVLVSSGGGTVDMPGSAVAAPTARGAPLRQAPQVPSSISVGEIKLIANDADTADADVAISQSSVAAAAYLGIHEESQHGGGGDTAVKVVKAVKAVNVGSAVESAQAVKESSAAKAGSAAEGGIAVKATNAVDGKKSKASDDVHTQLDQQMTNQRELRERLLAQQHKL